MTLGKLNTCNKITQLAVRKINKHKGSMTTATLIPETNGSNPAIGDFLVEQ